MIATTHRRIWTALALYAVLALVPGAGLVLCMQADGETHLGLGATADCPCPPGHDGTHPPCVDVVVDGQRDLLPPGLPVPDLQPSAWVDLAALAVVRFVPLDESGGGGVRDGPPPRAPTAPHLRRALAERTAVVLLI